MGVMPLVLLYFIRPQTTKRKENRAPHTNLMKQGTWEHKLVARNKVEHKMQKPQCWKLESDKFFIPPKPKPNWKA
jgi:hypothetical protein